MGNREKPLVSVIIPGYNHERYIADAIKSVIGQTYGRIELAIINDASRDATGKVAESYSEQCRERFDSFRFVDHPINMGLTRTLNQEIPKTKGEFICVLASDDVFAPEKIERQVGCFQEMDRDHALGAIITNGRGIDAEGVVDQSSRLVPDEIVELVRTNTALKNYAMLFERGWYIPAPSLMLRREALLEAGMYDEGTALEDFDMMLKILKRRNISILDEDLTYYRSHENNYMRSNFDKFIPDYLSLIIREKEYCEKNGISAQWRGLIQRFIYEQGFLKHYPYLLKSGLFLRSVPRFMLWTLSNRLSGLSHRIRAFRSG